MQDYNFFKKYLCSHYYFFLLPLQTLSQQGLTTGMWLWIVQSAKMECYIIYTDNKVCKSIWQGTFS